MQKGNYRQNQVAFNHCTELHFKEGFMTSRPLWEKFKGLLNFKRLPISSFKNVKQSWHGSKLLYLQLIVHYSTTVQNQHAYCDF